MHQDAAFSAIRRALIRLLSDFAEPVPRFLSVRELIRSSLTSIYAVEAGGAAPSRGES